MNTRTRTLIRISFCALPWSLGCGESTVGPPSGPVSIVIGLVGAKLPGKMLVIGRNITAQLAVTGIDATGHELDNLNPTFTSRDLSVAAMASDGTLTAGREAGITFVVVTVPGRNGVITDSLHIFDPVPVGPLVSTRVTW